MKVDQVILEQLDTVLNGSGSSGSGKGNGEFAAVLDKALTGETRDNSTGSGKPRSGESVEASDNKEEMVIIEQKVAESKEGDIDEAKLEEKLELLMLSLLKSDQAELEKFAANKEQQNGKPVEDKIIAALKGEKISAEVLKEELVAKIEQQVKQEGGFKVKEEVIARKPEAEISGINDEAKGKADLKATKTSAEKEALLKDKTGKVQNADKAKEALLNEKTVKAHNADKTNEAGKKVAKDAASKKELTGQTAEKQANMRDKTFEPEINRLESAGKTPKQQVIGNKEEVKDVKVTAEQGSEKSTDQKAAKANNARQDLGLNSGRYENSKAEANTQRSQNVSPAQEQNIAQQSTIRGDEALQGNRALNPQNANLRESVMQQLQGRMTYLRESGNNPAEMRVTLHPPELGEITVRVFSSKGRLSASIIAETPLAREILESSITELRQRMNFVNIQFDQLDVSTAGKEYEGFDRPGEREGSGKAEFGEAEGNEKRSAESEPPPQQISHDDAGSGIDFWA